jgi:hypothetical protein
LPKASGQVDKAASTEPKTANFYVAPGGKASNDGSKTAPWDLLTALSQPKSVKPGSTIWLRGGTYGDGTAIFHSRLLGTPERPIILRQYPGERATINGWLQIGCCDLNPQPENGGYTWFWGFELTNSIADRTGSPAGPPDWGKSAVPNAVDSWAPGTRFINLVIHDTREGIGWWTEATGGEAYGNIIYYNGFQAQDRGHGHGIYVQNREGIKTLEDNIIFDQFGIGIHGYGSSKAWVRGLVLRGNVSFDNGTIARRGLHDDNMLFGVGTGLDNITLDSNFTYHTPSDDQGHSSIGWQFSPDNKTANILNNYWIGGDIAVMVARWDKVAFTNNTVLSNSKNLVGLEILAGQNKSNYSWDGNRYWGSGTFISDGKQMNWDQWRSSTGFDHNSQFHSGRPVGTWAFIRPNKYEQGRANIVIYNWDLKPQIAIDPGKVLRRGSHYQVRDVQDFYGPAVCSGVYDGRLIDIPMTNLRTAKPNGNVPTPPRHTSSEFGVFVLLAS